MENIEKIQYRKELFNEAREYMINALHRNLDIIKSFNLQNNIDYYVVNNHIDNTIKLLELLKVKFVDAKDIDKEK